MPPTRVKFVPSTTSPPSAPTPWASAWCWSRSTWLHSLRSGKPAPANPWGSNTLEWRTPRPPPHDNFKETPVAGDPYDLHGWEQIPGKDEWVLDKNEHQTMTARRRSDADHADIRVAAIRPLRHSEPGLL